MIVRDTDKGWQVVTQPHHADLSGQLCRAWGSNGLVSPRPADSVAIASVRHDDGWAVWERAPGLDPETGAPRNFLNVQVLLHLDFYRAGISAITDEDPYAGLLASMHGAGIYRERYGAQPGLKLTFQEAVQERVDAFVAEQEASFPERIAGLGVSDEERWVNYKFLQLFDRLSLYFCMKDLDNGEADELAPIPVDYDGGEVTLQMEPRGPWHIRLDPYPFAESPSTFTLERRVLPKTSWAGDAEFRAELFDTATEVTQITVER